MQIWYYNKYKTYTYGNTSIYFLLIFTSYTDKYEIQYMNRIYFCIMAKEGKSWLEFCRLHLHFQISFFTLS